MMRILDRYVLREVFPSFLLGVLVFTFVILLNEILRFAQQLVSQAASLSDTLGILLNLLPSVLCLTIPMGFLLGVLVALGRLAADSEIIAMRASGVSLYRLLIPILVASTIAWSVSSYLIIKVLPDSNQQVRQLFFKVLTTQAGKEVRPRVFYDGLFPNIMFLVLDTPTGSSHWQNIILADLSRPQSPQLTFANKGQLLINPDERTVTFHLRDAELHQVSRNRPADYQRQASKEIFLPLPSERFFPPEEINVPRGARELGLQQLRSSLAESGLPIYATELHKKFSIPFACFVFGILGLALGIQNRRDGRSWGFIASLTIIFIYYIFIDIGENMAITGQISPFFGMWTPNIILGIAAIALLIRAARESNRLFFSFNNYLPRIHVPTDNPKQDPAHIPARTVIVLKIPRLSLRFPNTIDRYVSREFTRYFLLILAALINVYVLGLLIDVIADAFEYEVNGSLVLQYLFFAMPQIFFHMLPLTTLMATLVCFAIFTKTSEITAIKASGISLYRICVSVVLLGAVVSTGCFVIQEYLLPYANRRAAELRNEIKKAPVQTYNILDRQWMMGEQQEFYNYAYYDPNVRKFSGLSVYRYKTDPFTLTERHYAQEATWEPEMNSWVYGQGWKRNFDNERKFERFESLVVQDMEPPSYFSKEQKRSNQMTYLELSSYVSDLKRAGYDVVPLEVALRSKLSFPLAAMVMVLIGVPFSFTPGKKGALYGIGIAIAIGLSYYVTTRVFAFMGETGLLHSILAAWAPNLLFGIAALYGLFNVRT